MNMTLLNDDDCQQSIAATKQGLLLVFKNLCPHCKNMEKMLEKFAVLAPNVTLLCLDLEASSASAAALGAERPPTLFVIKEGAVRASKTGLMNPRECKTYFDQA